MTISWCFPDQSSPYSESVLEALQKRSAVVPAHWALEVANVLLVAERKARLTEAQSFRLVHLLDSLPITIDGNTASQALAQTLILGRHHRLSSYDSACLELALREGLPLATQDEALKKAASEAGVELIE